MTMQLINSPLCLQEVGLPSRLAGFVQDATQAAAIHTAGRPWWRRVGDTGDGDIGDAISLLDKRHRQQVCVIRLPRVAAHARLGPPISMVLPNFRFVVQGCCTLCRTPSHLRLSTPAAAASPLNSRHCCATR